MATKKITPKNPDTKVTDETEVEDTATAAERKTAAVKTGRKTSGFRGY